MKCLPNHPLTVLTLVLLMKRTLAGDFPEKCQSPCKCDWVSNNKDADCTNSNFTKIPDGLSDEVQVLRLSHNQIPEIVKDAFINVRLENLKKLHLDNCGIETIHPGGFQSLTILTEVNLSNNSIETLHRDTFKHLDKITTIKINGNQLQKLPEGLFSGLNSLQIVDLGNNRIHTIAVKAFENLPKLNKLFLASNHLTILKSDIFDNLQSLATLDLADNAWKCDCNLRPFYTWVRNIKVFTTDRILCKEPENVKNNSWNKLAPQDFACKPIIIHTKFDSNQTYDGNGTLTISCQMYGDPEPEVRWIKESKDGDIATLSRDSKYDIITTLISPQIQEKRVNLVISDPNPNDDGNYSCVVSNSAGSQKRSVTLTVNKSVQNVVFTVAGIDGHLFLILVISIAFLVILFVSVIICVCLCKKRPKKNKARPININNSAPTPAETLNRNETIVESDPVEVNLIDLKSENSSTYDSIPLSRLGHHYGSATNINHLTLDKRTGYMLMKKGQRPRIGSYSSTISYITNKTNYEPNEPTYDTVGTRTTASGSSTLSLNRLGIEPARDPRRHRRRVRNDIEGGSSHSYVSALSTMPRNGINHKKNKLWEFETISEQDNAERASLLNLANRRNAPAPLTMIDSLEIQYDVPIYRQYQEVAPQKPFRNRELPEYMNVVQWEDDQQFNNVTIV